MNNFTVKIKQNDGFVALTATAVFPFRFGELLDERLDEAYVDIINDSVEEYEPLTEFSITVTVGAETVTKYYILARDQAQTNQLTGKVKHSLYLLERTKKLEGIICPSLTFTNEAAKNYTPIPTLAIGASSLEPSWSSFDDLVGDQYYSSHVLSPIKVGYFTPPSANSLGKSIAETVKTRLNANYVSVIEGVISPSEYDTIYYTECKLNVLGELYTAQGNETFSVDISFPNVYNLEYTIVLEIIQPIVGVSTLAIRCIFPITVLQSRLPLKKWTITDCVQRVLECAEPISSSSFQNPTKVAKYKFNAEQAAKYDTVLAPEFSMTQCTLREQLKIIGSYIHAEPRLNESDEIYFQEYGGELGAGVSGLPCVYKASSWDINQYCTEVHSNAQNLVSALGYAEGALVEPARGWYRSLRSETVTARLGEGNGKAETLYPIYGVQSVLCGILSETGEYMVNPCEIVDYLFEATVYGANLSSYSNVSGFSKSYALYYTLGSPNIEGLFFRASTALPNSVFGRFAITNILGSVQSDVSSQDIEVYLQQHPERLIFQITYKPIYPMLISHGKSLYTSGERFSMVYNQSDNLVETQYYGENLKGVAARLGNVERERTFLLSKFSQIPRTGQMLDGYAISAVSVEIMPMSIKCTLGLTKDFNRISEYVGVSSVKRMYEISERQVYNRDILIHNTALISLNYPTPKSALFNSVAVRRSIAGIFDPSTNTVKPISTVIMRGLNKSGSAINNYDIALPVIPSALGNAMTFYAAFKDNYSAGGATVTFNSSDGVEGYWLSDVRYTDYYGRLYNLRMWFVPSLKGANAPTSDPYLLPEYNGSLNFDPEAIVGNYLVRKDSRERLSVTAELEFKTDDESIIVGSGLARYCSLVSDIDTYTVKVILFTDRSKLPTKFEKKLPYDGTYVEANATLTVEVIDLYVKLSVDATLPGRTIYGWAICTGNNTVAQEVEDEDGQVVVQSEERGRDILISRIHTVHGTPTDPPSASELFPPIYISVIDE